MTGYTALAVMVVTALFLYAFMIQGTKRMLRKRMSARVRESRCACLTFDDGPHPEQTPIILDLLRQAGVRATFFVVGVKAEQHRALLERIRREGHEIGEHGYSHLHAWLTNPLRLVRDLWRCAAVTASFGVPSGPVLFRPPHGKLSFMTWVYVIARNRRLAFWNIDPKDYAQDAASAVSDHVAAHLAEGAVVLLHDGSERRESGRSGFVTAGAVEVILRDAAARNIRLVPMGEALGLRDPR